jgi:transposase
MVANRVNAYRYLVDLFAALPCANSADDFEALNRGKPERHGWA